MPNAYVGSSIKEFERTHSEIHRPHVRFQTCIRANLIVVRYSNLRGYALASNFPPLQIEHFQPAFPWIDLAHPFIPPENFQPAFPWINLVHPFIPPLLPEVRESEEAVPVGDAPEDAPLASETFAQNGFDCGAVPDDDPVSPRG